MATVGVKGLSRVDSDQWRRYNVHRSSCISRPSVRLSLGSSVLSVVLVLTDADVNDWW